MEGYITDKVEGITFKNIRDEAEDYEDGFLWLKG